MKPEWEAAVEYLDDEPQEPSRPAQRSWSLWRQRQRPVAPVYRGPTPMDVVRAQRIEATQRCARLSRRAKIWALWGLVGFVVSVMAGWFWAEFLIFSVCGFVAAYSAFEAHCARMFVRTLENVEVRHTPYGGTGNAG